MAVWKRPRPARAGESPRADHFTYVLRWRLGGDGAWQNITIGHTRGHEAEAITLDERVAELGYNVTKADVAAWLAGDDDDDDEADLRPPTVGELVAEYAMRPNLSKQTRITYAMTVRHLGDMADVRADALTRKQVNRWLSALGERYATKTMRGHVAVLKGSLRDHANVRDLFRDVAYDPHETKVRHVILTDDEVGALIANAGSTGLALPIRVLAETGLRWGELAGLTVGDIDIAGRVINVERQVAQSATRAVGGFRTERLKTRSSRRVVPISDDLADALALVVLQAEHDAPAFRDPRGEWWRYGTARHQWEAIKRATPTVPNHTRLHDLRHTAAMRWLRRGVPIGLVSRMLGHSNVGITDKAYSHWGADDHALIINAALRL